MRHLLLLSLCLPFVTFAPAKLSAADAPAQAAPLRWSLKPYDAPHYYLNSVAVSADGDYVLAGTYQHDYTKQYPADYVPPLGTYGAYMYDRHGKLRWKDEFRGHEGAYWTAVSPAGGLASVGGWFSYAPKTGFVTVYQAASGEKLLEFRSAPTRIGVVSIARSEQLVVAGADHHVYLFERQRGRFDAMPLVIALPDPTPDDHRPDKVTGIAATPRGDYLVVTTISGQVALIHHERDRATLVHSYPTGIPMRTLAMSRDGRFAAAGGGLGQVLLFDLKQFARTGKPSWSAAFDQAGAGYGIDFSADGKRVVAIANFQDIGLVGMLDNDTRPGEWVWQAKVDRNPNAVAINRAGTRIALATGFPGGKPGAFDLLDAKDGRLIWQQVTGDMNWPIEFAADSDLVVAGSDDGKLYVFGAEH